MLLQKKAIRNIAKASYLDHTHPLFVQYKCLKFLDIVKLKTLIIIYKAKNNMLPINLQILFITIYGIHSYGTRSSKKGNFNVKFCKTKRKLIPISIMGVKLWKQLDANVHNVKTINILKHIIKNSMFISLHD